MARTGFTSGRLQRTTNLPGNGRTATLAAVCYVDGAGTNRDLCQLVNAAETTSCGIWQHSTTGNLGMWYAGVTTLPAVAVTTGWYKVVCVMGATSAACKVFARRLDSTTVQTATGSGGTPTSFVPAFFRTSLDWAGPLQSMNVWGVSLSDAAAVQELYAVIPRWRSNLLLDWRGFHNLHDASGNGNVSLVAGSLTEADGGPISMGARAHFDASAASYAAPVLPYTYISFRGS
jgi:hypothetical protein